MTDTVLDLKPETVERDENGHWCHSALKSLFTDEDDQSELNTEKWIEDRGYETELVYMDEDLDEDSDLYNSYFEEGKPDISNWYPTAPLSKEGEEPWILLIISDGEISPYALFARKTKEADAASGGRQLVSAPSVQCYRITT
jgi:O6-methylguanine-DNA--protein-cysteine methyltransferase